MLRDERASVGVARAPADREGERLRPVDAPTRGGTAGSAWLGRVLSRGSENDETG